jgi:hypothetical protein
MAKLTGNTRFRLGLRGRLVLQVEEQFSGITAPFGDPGRWTEWRDAKVADLRPPFLPRILPKNEEDAR